VYDTGK